MDIKLLKINIELHINKYKSYKQQGQYEKAVEELEKLIVILYQVIDNAEKNITKFLNFLRGKTDNAENIKDTFNSNDKFDNKQIREEYLSDQFTIITDEKGNFRMRRIK